MSDTVRYLDREETRIILWALLEGRVLSGKSTFLRRIRFKGIQEVRSGAIIPNESTPGFFVLELNTATGPRKFHHAEEVTGGDVQSDSDPILWETVHFAEAISHANPPVRVSRERPLLKAGTPGFRVSPGASRSFIPNLPRMMNRSMHLGTSSGS